MPMIMLVFDEPWLADDPPPAPDFPEELKIADAMPIKALVVELCPCCGGFWGYP